MQPAEPPLADLGPLGFVGAGAVGTTLARAWAARGATVAAVTALHPGSARALADAIPGCQAVPIAQEVTARSRLLFLAIPDDALATVTASLSLQEGQAAIHFSGARGADVLAVASEHGAAVAALHPLMTFSAATAHAPVSDILARLAGCTWALEASQPALASDLRRLVDALDGHVVSLGADNRVPYHLSGVLASNYVVALLGAAVQLWTTFGAAEEEALRSLLPLLRGTVDNLASVGLPQALTGPVARGDAGTVERHMDWLAAHANDDPRIVALRDAYVALARLAMPLAEAKGSLSPERVGELERVLRNGRTSPPTPSP